MITIKYHKDKRQQTKTKKNQRTFFYTYWYSISVYARRFSPTINPGRTFL